jgi:DNA-binding Lrp family transcriptional regulator
MSASGTAEDRAATGRQGNLDYVDAGLLKGLSLDGRRSASELARELGIGRAYASKKLRALLKRRGVRIRAFTNPTALGYRAGAVTRIQVAPGQMNQVADTLGAMPWVCLLMITCGWEDVVIFSMFPGADDMSAFLTEGLSKVRGIQSTETLIIADWRVRHFLAKPGTGFYSYLSSRPADHDRHLRTSRPGPSDGEKKDADPGLDIDILDLKILNEIEREPRQQVSVLARKVGVSQKSASARLHGLLAANVTRVGVYTTPFEVGLNFFPVVGVKVSMDKMGALLKKLEALPDVYFTVRVSGRYDLLVGTMFAGPVDVSRFIWQKLAPMPGVLSMETTIGLEIRKWSLPYLAGARLDCIAEGKAGIDAS